MSKFLKLYLSTYLPSVIIHLSIIYLPTCHLCICLRLPSFYLPTIYLSGLPWWLRQLKVPPAKHSELNPGSIPGSGRSPGKGNGKTHSSILAWRTPWTEEPNGPMIYCLPSYLPIISIHRLLLALSSWRSRLTQPRARISGSGHLKSDLGMRILVLTLECTLNTLRWRKW